MPQWVSKLFNLLRWSTVRKLGKSCVFSRKIGHVIQIVVHQFVRKRAPKKFQSLKKIDPPLSQGMRKYVESVPVKNYM
jgi:hypothetical protein